MRLRSVEGRICVVAWTGLSVAALVSCHAPGSAPALDLPGPSSDVARRTQALTPPRLTYEVVDFPGALGTVAYDINNRGEVVGEFLDRTGTHGFLLSAGRYVPITVPGSTFTRAVAINDAGQVVGSFRDPETFRSRGFLLVNGTFTVLDVPGAMNTDPRGINDATPPEIAGSYTDEAQMVHGFLLLAGSYATFDHPATNQMTVISHINDARAFVGLYFNADKQLNSGFLASGAGVSEVAPPDAEGNATFAHGINNQGKIVGQYLSAAHGFAGFLYEAGSYSPITGPNGAFSATAYGINDLGHIVGAFDNTAGAHGFIARPGCTLAATRPFVSPTNVVEGLSCGPAQPGPLRIWRDEENRGFALFCQDIPGAAPEFHLNYSGRVVGRCPWRKGRNLGEIQHGGDSDGDGTFDCFVRSFWRSEELDLDQGIDPHRIDWKVYLFDVTLNKLVARHFISVDGPGGEPDHLVKEDVDADILAFDPPAGSPPMTADPFASCDVDRTGACDQQDRLAVEGAIGACMTGANYNELADADHDGCVSLVDRALHLSSDFDDDGLLDFEESCPTTNRESTVIIDGCDSGVPNVASGGCNVSDGVFKCTLSAANHDEFVSCVAELARERGLSGRDRGALVSCAGQADLP